MIHDSWCIQIQVKMGFKIALLKSPRSRHLQDLQVPGHRILVSRAEAMEAKHFGDPGLRLLGFKCLSSKQEAVSCWVVAFLKFLFNFHPDLWGNDPLWVIFFQMGWYHQLGWYIHELVSNSRITGVYYILGWNHLPSPKTNSSHPEDQWLEDENSTWNRIFLRGTGYLFQEG